MEVGMFRWPYAIGIPVGVSHTWTVGEWPRSKLERVASPGRPLAPHDMSVGHVVRSLHVLSRSRALRVGCVCASRRGACASR